MEQALPTRPLFPNLFSMSELRHGYHQNEVGPAPDHDATITLHIIVRHGVQGHGSKDATGIGDVALILGGGFRGYLGDAGPPFESTGLLLVKVANCEGRRNCCGLSTMSGTLSAHSAVTDVWNERVRAVTIWCGSGMQRSRLG